MTRRTNNPIGEYAVGYKRPPRASQFQKGQSGNPKGRPKGAPTVAQLFEQEAARLVTIKSGDRIRQVPKREAIVRRLLDMSLQGDLGAARLVLPHLFAPSVGDDGEEVAAAPLNEAERAAMQILVERLTQQGGANE